MAAVEEPRLELNALQAELDRCKEGLAQLDEARKTLDPDPEFDAAFALQQAEIDYYIASVEQKIKRLKFQLELMEPNTIL